MTAKSKTAFLAAHLPGESYLTFSAIDLAFWNDEKAKKVAMGRGGTMIKPRHDSETARGVDFRSGGYPGFKNIKFPSLTLPRLPGRILN